MPLAQTLAALDAKQRRRPRGARRSNRRDVFGDPALNLAIHRIVDADTIHSRMDPAAARDLELRAAFASYPSGWAMKRVLECARNLRRVGLAPHLTDEHLRLLWRERG